MGSIHETEDGGIGATQTGEYIDEGAAVVSKNCDETFQKEDFDKHPNGGTSRHLEMLDEAGHSSKDLLTGVLLTNEQFGEGAVEIKSEVVEGATQDNQEKSLTDVESDKGAENEVHNETSKEATQIDAIGSKAQSITRPIDFKLYHSDDQPATRKVLVGKLLSIGVTDVPDDNRENKHRHKRIRLNSEESVGETSEASPGTSAHIRGEGYGIIPIQFATRPIPTRSLYGQHVLPIRDGEDPGDREPGDREPEEYNLNDSRAKSGTDDQTGSEDEARVVNDVRLSEGQEDEARVVNDVRLSEVPLLNLDALKGTESAPGSARSGASLLSGASARDGGSAHSNESARSNESEWRRQMAMFPFYSLPMYGFPPSPFPPVISPRLPEGGDTLLRPIPHLPTSPYMLPPFIPHLTPPPIQPLPKKRKIRKPLDKPVARSHKVKCNQLCGPGVRKDPCDEMFNDTHELVCHIAIIHQEDERHACSNCAKYSLDKKRAWDRRIEHERLRRRYHVGYGGAGPSGHVVSSDSEIIDV